MRVSTIHPLAGVDSDRVSFRGSSDALRDSSSPGKYNRMEMGANEQALDTGNTTRRIQRVGTHGTAENPVVDDWKWMWEVLLVVATLLVGVTYQAGLNPPGGVWQDFSNSKNSDEPPVRHKPGYPILKDLPRDRVRYVLFNIFNAFAFGYSLGTLVVLLLTVKKRTRKVAMMMRTTMVISLLFLGIAFCLGCSRNKVSTMIYIFAASPAFLCTSVVLYYWDGMFRKREN